MGVGEVKNSFKLLTFSVTLNRNRIWLFKSRSISGLTTIPSSDQSLNRTRLPQFSLDYFATGSSLLYVPKCTNLSVPLIFGHLIVGKYISFVTLYANKSNPVFLARSMSRSIDRESPAGIMLS